MAAYAPLYMDRPHEADLAPPGSGACQHLPLAVPLVELIMVSNPPLGVLVFRSLGASRCQRPPVSGSGPRRWSYRALHHLWLPLLGLGAFGKGQAVCQGQLPAVPRPEWVISTRPKAARD